ncbi:MAG TPA: MFS transporter, partial [Anaeromyxobacteraceae bacterium]|nr:MFS transporter [Anaeromyxobacteraceae bacterium]
MGNMPLLARLGLHRPELRAWALYDWANSAFVTTVVAAVFPVYFSSVAAAGLPRPVATQRYAVATTLALVIVAFAAPVLGTVADAAASKKRLLGAFLALGVASVAALFAVERGDWLLAAALFVLANVGANGSFVFYDALLPHVARGDELDRVSTAGYALGYLGGGLLLAVNLAWIQRPELFGLPSGPGLSPSEATLPARLAFLSVAVWWAAFALPLFFRVREPAAVPLPSSVLREPRGERRPPLGAAAIEAARRLRHSAAALRRHPQAALLLVAFLVYNDGIGTIIRMATIYGTEIGLDRGALIASILLVQFVGIPFAFLFGALAGRIGAKRAIFLALAVYTVVSVIGFFVRTAGQFFAMALLVGMVQGGSQALSRSLFARMIPASRSGEFFGFFAVTEKFAGIFVPAVFALAIGLTGSSRAAILSVIAFFVVGGALLAKV